MTAHPLHEGTPTAWCTVCGSVVVDSRLHAAWHAEVAR